ncbi:unnamed protein product [Soboliphyme baturini]|uniref:Arrestin_C domain-containing protein n=1 Tax=Soboliphyme baturini TaxID=241478 RepID=A0A183IEU1_9BILA|nr:unnamed protein product [Soboliphyme baturini]
MGKIECFEITLKNDRNVYFAGEEVVGKLVIALSIAQKVEQIVLQFKGRAKTNWAKHQGKTSTHYSDEEVYFDSSVDTNYPNQFEGQMLPAQVHEIPISFQLPAEIPSSYEGSHGHIRYECKAMLSRAWKLDILCKKQFRVIAQVDFNSVPGISRPVTIRKFQQVYCCCFNRGHVAVNISMARRGFVPGEDLEASCEVVNESVKAITAVCLRFVQSVVFRGKTVFLGYSGAKEVSTEGGRVEMNTSIERGTTKKLDLTLQIPPVPPTLSNCNIIEISYHVSFSVGSFIDCSIPITIGTVKSIDPAILSATDATFNGDAVAAALNQLPSSPPSEDTSHVILDQE